MKTNTGKQHERACLICSDNWQLFLYTVPFKPAAWNQKTKKCKSGFAMQTKEVTLRRDPRDSMQTQRRNSHISQHPHGSFGWVWTEGLALPFRLRQFWYLICVIVLFFFHLACLHHLIHVHTIQNKCYLWLRSSTLSKKATFLLEGIFLFSRCLLSTVQPKP